GPSTSLGRKAISTPLAVSTSRNGPQRCGGSRPSTSAMNSAPSWGSSDQTIVWFSSTATPARVPARGDRSTGASRRGWRETGAMGELIGSGVRQIDTLLGGWERVTAGYLIEGPAPVLVETGSQSSVEELLAALEGIGVSADELAGVAVTHIHLDHAGGVGDVARAFPRATVYVHEKAARH